MRKEKELKSIADTVKNNLITQSELARLRGVSQGQIWYDMKNGNIQSINICGNQNLCVISDEEANLYRMAVSSGKLGVSKRGKATKTSNND